MKKNRLIGIIALSILAIFCFVMGCDKAESNSTGTISKSLTITNKQVIMQIGDVVEFNVELKGISETVSWQSDDPTIINVSDNGVAEALKVGRTKLTATAGKYSDSIEITVSNEDIPVLNLNKDDTIVLYKNNTFMVSPSVLYKGDVVRDNIVYSFTSDNDDIAEVDPDGTITAKEVGECNIIVSTEYRYTMLSGSYKVNVVEGNFITLSKNNVSLSTLNYGEYSDAEAITAVAYKDGVEVPNAMFEWNTDDEAVATVVDGVITAKGVGTTKIKVAYNGLEVYTNVSVSMPTIETGLTFNYEALNAIELPEYEIEDFATENIVSVLYGQTDVYKDGLIDKEAVVGSSKAKVLTMVTAKANYIVSVMYYNKIISSKQDFEGITDSLAKLPVDKNDLSKGFYRDGYIVLEEDIAYDGEFEPIAHVDAGKPDGHQGVWYGSQLDCGFKGEFDGKGHTVSGIVINKSGGFFGAIIGSAYVHDLRIENAVIKAGGAGGLTTHIYNTAVVENVYVSGEIDSTNANISNSYQAMGIFSTGLATGSVTVKNCVAELTKPFDLSDSAKTKVSLFGYGYTCWEGIFIDCAAIGSDRLLGMCSLENADNIANEFEIITERTGITVYVNEGEYLVAMAEKDGYTKDTTRSTEANCTQDGQIVMVKSGFADKIITVNALGHIFIDGSVECQRSNCSATKVSKQADGDIKDGFDFKMLMDGESIVSVTCDGIPVSTDNGVITFNKADASMVAKNYTVSYANGNVVTVALTVWSLLIDSEEELKAMNQYTNVTTLSGAQKTWGYFKLTDDIAMTSAWSADYVVGKGDYIGGDHCFSGIFDGNGKTISNFVIPNAVNHVSMFYSVGKDFVMKDVKIEAENKTTGGNNSAIIAECISGGTFENIEITLKLPEVYIYANIITIGGGGLFEYFGSTASNYDITLNNVKVIAASNDMETVNCAPLGIIYCANTNQNAEALKSKIKLNGVVFAGFKNIMFDVVTPICTLDQLKGVSTCDADVKVYATLDEYKGISVTTLDPVDTDFSTGVDFASMISGTIANVTLDDTPVALTNGKLTYQKTDASADAKKYVITDTNGNKYYVSVTVWSLLIDNEEELTQMNQYTYTKQIYSMQATVGYFKLMDDIVMENPWKQPYAVGNGDYPQGDNGWHGVFEGNNKKISNFNLERSGNSANAGMFYALGKNSVIRNLKLEGINDAYYGAIGTGGGSGLLAYSVAGGTIENVELTVNVSDTYTPNTDPLCAGVFGKLHETQYNAKLVLKNVKIIAKDDTMANKTTIAPLGEMNYSVANNMIEMTNVVIAGFGNILYDTNHTAISNLDGLNTIATCNNVQVYATLADYQATLS